MSSVRSKSAGLEKGQGKASPGKNLTLDAGEDAAPILDLKDRDVSILIMEKLNALMKMQDSMFEEIRETFKNDVKEMLVKSAVVEEKNPKYLKDQPELRGSKPEEKAEEEDSKTDEGMQNLTLEGKDVKQGRKFGRSEEHSHGRDCFSLNQASHYGVVEAFGSRQDRCRKSPGRVEVLEGEGIRKEEEESAKEMQEGTKPQDSKKKENFVSDPREENSVKEGGARLSLSAEFSSATLEINKQWGDIFNILRENNLEPRLLCTVQLAFKCDGEVKTFSDLQSLRKFINQKPPMRELLKDTFPQDDPSQGGRRYGREKVKKALIDSKHEAGVAANDGLSFLFIKEINIARPEVTNSETGERGASEWKKEKTPRSEKQEASALEEEEEKMSEEEGEETSEGEKTSSGEGETEEASETGEKEEASETGEEEQMSEEGEVEEEEGKEASVLREKEDLTLQGLTVVDERRRNGLQVSLISLVVDSESEEEVEAIFQTETKEALYGLKDLAFSYLTWNSEKRQLLKCQNVKETQGKTAMPRSQGIGTPCLTLYLTSPSKSLERGNGDPTMLPCTNLRVPSGVTSLLRKKERPKSKQIDALSAKEADLIQGTEENFRRSVISMFREMQDEVENIKKSCSEIIEIKKSICDLSWSVGMLKTKVANQGNVIEEITKDTPQLTKQIIDEERLREREDSLRSSNIRLIGVPEKENKENEAEDIMKEIMEENFPDLKDLSLEFVSAHRIPSTVDQSRLTPRHILVTFLNFSDKRRVLKVSREKREITYRGTKVRMTADLSQGTLDARSQWADVIRVLHAEGFQPKILYPAKLTFSFQGKPKVFFDLEEFREFISNVPSLKDLLENVF